MPTKLGIGTDFHYGLTSEDINRTPDIDRIANEIIDRVIEEDCEYFVFMGDWFHNNNPKPEDTACAIHLANRLEEAQIESWLMVGNHDAISQFGRKHAMYPLKKIKFKYVKVIDDVRLIQHDDLGLLFLPHVTKAYTLSKAKVGPSEYLEMEAKRLYKQMDKDAVNLVFAHLNVAGAVSGSENYMIRGDHETLPEFLKTAKKLDYIFNGHIHKSQVIKGEVPIILPGSPETFNFGERNDTKGFVIVDLDEIRGRK